MRRQVDDKVAAVCVDHFPQTPTHLLPLNTGSACPSDTTFAQVTIVLGIDLPTQILMSNSNLTISRIL
ncbi:hypothetical protein PCANC_17060 [Puccinia coronata f. sp. avenae]|uniref:Uncharacterized protein n=1 Tax=Puccinia coronata f. sp. avenae TaxID=200324 RepID=A0A2N5SL95_9BASI|nr:hypothetical protein PCANC_17060 [Puccinia coronata f. sp. avenae]